MGIANSLTGVYGLGADALQNLYEVTELIVPKTLEKKVGLDKIAGRIQNISIPAVTQTPYSVHYKTGEVTKASGKHGTAKETSFQIRIDKNYDLYSFFYTWANIPNGTGNKMYINLPEAYVGGFTVSRLADDLKPVAGKTDKNKGWKFHHVWVSNVDALPLDYSVGDPVTVSITIQYAHMEIIDLEVPDAEDDTGVSVKKDAPKPVDKTLGKK